MKEYVVTLKLAIDEKITFRPDEGSGWNWRALLDLGDREEVEVVRIEEASRAKGGAMSRYTFALWGMMPCTKTIEVHAPSQEDAIALAQKVQDEAVYRPEEWTPSPESCVEIADAEPVDRDAIINVEDVEK